MLRTVVCLFMIMILAPVALAQSAQGSLMGQSVKQVALSTSQNLKATDTSVRVDVVFDDVPLVEALNKIAAEGRLQLIYSPELIPVDARVSIVLEGVPAVEAVRRTLRGQPVRMFSQDNTVVVVGVPVLAIATEAELEPGTIMGRVTDAASGVGLDGASVFLEGTSFGTVTGQTGGFRFTDVPVGTYTVVVQRLGYSEARQSVTVRDGQETTVNFALEVSAIALDEVVVTGSIIETRTKELPSPITVVSADEIQQKGVSRMDEVLLGEVPGLVVFDAGYSWYSRI